jgi:hypothetical protein
MNYFEIYSKFIIRFVFVNLWFIYNISLNIH